MFFALAFCATFVGTGTAYLQDFTKSKIAAHMIFQLIDRDSEVNPTSVQGVKPVRDPLISYPISMFCDLTKAFDTVNLFIIDDGGNYKN